MFAFEQLLKLFNKIEKFKYVEYKFFKGPKTHFFKIKKPKIPTHITFTQRHWVIKSF